MKCVAIAFIFQSRLISAAPYLFTFMVIFPFNFPFKIRLRKWFVKCMCSRIFFPLQSTYLSIVNTVIVNTYIFFYF